MFAQNNGYCKMQTVVHKGGLAIKFIPTLYYMMWYDICCISCDFDLEISKTLIVYLLNYQTLNNYYLNSQTMISSLNKTIPSQIEHIIGI